MCMHRKELWEKWIIKLQDYYPVHSATCNDLKLSRGNLSRFHLSGLFLCLSFDNDEQTAAAVHEGKLPRKSSRSAKAMFTISVSDQRVSLLGPLGILQKSHSG